MMAKGRKPVLQNARLLSIYLSDYTMDKLDLLASKTLGSKSAIARDIITKQLIKISAN